jgi:hypothetical protein
VVGTAAAVPLCLPACLPVLLLLLAPQLLQDAVLASDPISHLLLWLQ